MKAFQLKITLKDSKPPIWRRVIIPAGITFSQLSMILNEVMGWSGYHLFEMEFYQKKIRIMEDCDDFGYGWGGYQYLEASVTFIREYLENNKSFTYIYDMGDYWQHRVTIEKIIDDYELNYPQVLKYKGNCPPEDCGGIWGYYEKLEILENKSHPEHEFISEWMDCGLVEYDMENVNACLEHEYYYKWGKKENRRQQEIAEDMFGGNSGLRATKRDKNKQLLNSTKAEEKQLDELRSKLDQLKKEKEELLEKTEEIKKVIIANVTLRDIFSYFDLVTLQDIALENKDLKKIKSLSKKKLIEKLICHMLEPEVMEWYFLCMNDAQIGQFESAADGKKVFHEGQSDGLFQLHAAAYVGLLDDGSYVVPVDVKEAYNRMDSIEFHKKRKKISFLYDCTIAAENWYGITPISVFKKICDQCLFMENISETEIKIILSKIPTEYRDFVMVDDKIYALPYYPDDNGLLLAQDGKKFYISSSDEIREFALYGYTPSNIHVKNMERFLVEYLAFSKTDAKYVAIQLENMLRVDCTMGEIFEYLNSIDEFNLDKKGEIQLVDLLVELNNNTRKIANRGFTPNEIGIGIRPKPSNLW